MVQSNSIGSTTQVAFEIPSWVVDIIPVIICGLIFMRGVDRPTSVTEELVPVMATFFLVDGLGVFVARFQYIPDTLDLIFKYAFQPQAIIGGGFGMAIKTATSRGAKGGLFSGEAGIGPTPHTRTLVAVKNPHEQGYATMVGVCYLLVLFCIVYNFWLGLICRN